MILHCTPPDDEHISNPALGYLKGFLQSKGIEVKNVYWNLILAKSMFKFLRGMEKYTKDKGFLYVFPTLYVCRQILKKDFKKDIATPLDVLYLSIYSKEEICEMIYSIKEDIDEYIKRNNLHKTELAGFTLKSYQWLMDYYLIGRLKEMNPDIKIVIGGITGKDQGHAFMNLFSLADFAIWGEGEYPLFHLVRALKEGTPLCEVPNLVYREDSKVCLTEKCQENFDLDSYPFADHSDYIRTFKTYMTGSVLSDYMEAYGKYVSDEIPVVIPVWGSRSCNWNKCKFCVLNEEYSYRSRSPENIVEEIEYQSEKYGVCSFIFVDTEVGGTLKKFKSLLKLLIKSSAARGRKYRILAELSPLFITSETARYMRLASFAGVQIGFEALTDSLLEKMKKRHRFAHNIQALKFGKQNGLQISGLNLVRGIPSETKEDILESCSNLKFLRFLLKKYPLNPGFLRLDKGAPFYEDVPQKERVYWRNNPIWREIEPLHVIAETNKFEFLGFCKAGQNRLWADFENLLKFYTEQNRSYEWIEYENGSLVEERGLRLDKYLFDQNETDLLIFCDTVKPFSAVKKKFQHLSEDDLLAMLENLKDAGFLYYDKEKYWVISVLDASGRKVLEY